MKLTPRSYQIEAVSCLYQYFSAMGGNPLVAMPTGTGKSVVIALFLESIYRQWAGQKVLVLTHVKELIQQNYDKLIQLWPNAPAGINSAGLNRRDVHHKIIFAGIGSVAKKAAEFGHVDLVLIDEAHLVSPSQETMYQKFISGLLTVNPNLKVIGFTATPWRLGVGHITDNGIFTDIAFDITGMEAFNRLIEEGFLAPLVPKRTKMQFDVDGVHKRGGEFIAAELQTAVDRDELTEAALKETLELGADRRHWLVFASGVEHAINVNNMLNMMGVPSVVIHSNLTNQERDDAILGFKSGKYRAAVNNNVLTTGFDFPAIDFIVMLRPTSSPVLWVQMLGRGTRPFSCEEWVKENCLVLDFAGNTKRLGPINDPLIPRKKGERVGEAPVRICQECQTYNHASAKVCMVCGFVFPAISKLKQAASTEELIKQSIEPVVEVFKVDHITYSQSFKEGREPIMTVAYYCGLRKFTDYVCLQHDGYAARKARQWWRERSEDAPPERIADAMERASQLKVPTQLRVWINKKYPEILGYCYDGTAFGTIAPVAADFPTRAADTAQSVPDDFYDDIPF